MTRYTLHTTDLAYGCDLGKWRFVRSVADGRRERRPELPDRIANDMNAALAELAVARVLGLPVPTSINTFHRLPDLPPDIEVRSSVRADARLIIRDDDDRARRFVLVTGTAPTLDIRGWIFGTEVVAAWRADYGGHGEAWFVPTEALHDLATFDSAVPA